MSSTGVDVAKQLRSIDLGSFSSEADRKEAVTEVRALLSRLETSWETAFRLSWSTPAQLACIQTALNLSLFAKWKAAGGQPKTEDELVELVPGDPVLISRSSTVSRVLF